MRRRAWPPDLGDVAAWWPDAAALLVAGGALAVALLGPRALPDTDPFGVDPYGLRLAAVTILLLAATAARPVRPALPVLIGVAAVVLPFVLWSAANDLWALTVVPAGNWFGRDLSLGFRSGVLMQDAAYLAATLGAAGVALLASRRSRRAPPALRVASLPPRAVAATGGLVVAMAVVTLAIPAQVLGRVALPLARLATDMSLLGPAFALQGAAQEFAFRGVLLGTLERSMPRWLANGGQALLFGLAHVAVMYEGVSASIVPVTVALGFALGWVTQRTGSIWPAVAVHAIVEIGQGYLVLPGLYGL
ncbi:MAG TPA: type II CAAX endopeptidase family protein [Candidatus Dormibacteraeota bacterium]|nr:type II CAAX endopeptidase family protein [Candidatus Dormibacteraeota bacterium]